MSFTKSDQEFMRLALLEASKISNRVSPNPKVGAVIVQNGSVISKGSHLFFGGPHAEINAIQNSNGKTKGADLYVTLEPCSHFGKTPPCTEAIIKAGFKRVFFGMTDPNPLVRDKNSRAILEKAGIEVFSGLLEEEAILLNQPFIKGMQSKTPYIIAKWAMTMDGKICTSDGESQWITNEKARELSHHLRAEYDAVAIGKNTLEKDDPQLDCRYGIQISSPFRLIFLSRVKNEYLNKKVFLNTDGKTILILKEMPENSLAEELQNRKIQLMYQKDSLEVVLKSLYQLGIASLLIEGGGTLLGRFFDQSLVDYCHCFLAPKILGGNGQTPVKGQGISKIADAWQLKTMKFDQIDDNIHLHGHLKLYR